ncbi:sugar ABC transporter ATP-binding protein [bacterium]|nr:sugar ABC transporter ATP-binding protein [bacterium]
MSQQVLQMVKINKSFAGVRVLRDVDFDLQAGEAHAVVGENGAGKSTLMKILAGIHRADSGQIVWKGMPVEMPTPASSLRLGISMVHQELTLAQHLTVAENLYLGREPLRQKQLGIISRRSLFRQAEQLVHENHFDLDPSAIVLRLSIAQRQLVEIARALAAESEVIIMDEPTSSLSAREAEEFFQVVRRLKAKGVGVIYISHRLEELHEVADRITVLRDGQRIITTPFHSIEMSEIIRHMVGRKLSAMFPKREAKIGEEVLRVENLSRAGVLHGISFSLRAGEILSVAGLVGAGRTELARAVFGVDRIDSGRIFLLGKEIRLISPSKAIAAGMGYLTEDRKVTGLALNLNILTNVTLSNLKKLVSFGKINLREERKVAGQYATRLRITTPSLRQKVLRLSGGNQQKVAIAKWLFAQSKVIIFDEPTRGIDVAAKRDVFELFVELTRMGAGILMLSSELPEILGMSDRVLVMRRGKIVGELDPRHTNQEEVLRLATLGAERAA